MASSIVIFVKLSNYESLNTFSSYLKTISKSFYCENTKVYIRGIYSPNCDLKLWIIFEFGNLLHRFTDHSTFLYIKACKDSELCKNSYRNTIHYKKYSRMGVWAPLQKHFLRD